MTGKQEDNYKMAAMIIFWVVMIFFLGFLVGGGCSGGSGDDWFERSASHGERWDAR